MAKRTAKRAKAEAELKVATEADDKNDVDKFSKRLVRVTRDHNEDCKKLLSLMGVPVVTVSLPLELVFRPGFACSWALQSVVGSFFTRKNTLQLSYEKLVHFVLPCVSRVHYTLLAGSFRSGGPMRCSGSRRSCVRYRHRRYGRAYVSDPEAAAAHDVFWCFPADPGS